MQKVSASLFNFLDEKAQGSVTFHELIKRLYPMLHREEFELVARWAVEDEEVLKSHSVRKFVEKKKDKLGNDKVEKKPSYPVPKEAIKKMRSIFELYDEGQKGGMIIVSSNHLGVSLADMIKHFTPLFSVKEVEKTFKAHDKDGDGMLNLKEFIEVILPPDFYIDPASI